MDEALQHDIFLVLVTFGLALVAMGVVWLVGNRLTRPSAPAPTASVSNPDTPLPAHKDFWQRHGPKVLLVISVALFLLFPHLMRWLYGPDTGAFDPGTINALALGVMEFMAACQVSFLMYYRLFPRLYAYVQECMEGKLLENVTKELAEMLTAPGQLDTLQLAQLAERRRVATLQFSIRCVRMLLSLLPYFVLLFLAVRLLSSALIAVPS
ncbi:hypothetical protein [Hymenobacter sp. BT491]|uniref:hypothetical protein n=1 Tax=Hymenobacter sp. BT491 TaxID=2766779 RepID=UPI001653E128|nr:hypothetical protein [Hymenobacter sp. BT491]MBC6988915.1 hypothetical protein [Hymenobacter sp. BT491]